MSDSVEELARLRRATEHLMGDRSNFPLFRKWFPDIPFDDRYKVMAVHIEEALRKLDQSDELLGYISE